MRSFRKTRQSDRQSTSRRDFLRVERLEVRWALATASPLAVNDFYHDLVNQPLDIGMPGILANDTSSSGEPLSAGLFSGPAQRHARSVGRWLVSLRAGSRLSGSRQLSLFANDGGSDSMLAAVTIDVGDGGPPPKPPTIAYSLDEDGTLNIAMSDGVLANDTAAAGESLTLSSVAGQRPRPTARSRSAADGSFTYVPNANFNGTDSFTYSATDWRGRQRRRHGDDHRQSGERQAGRRERFVFHDAKIRR